MIHINLITIILVFLLVAGIGYYIWSNSKQENFWGNPGFSYEKQKVIYPRDGSSPYSLPKRDFNMKYGNQVRPYITDQTITPEIQPRFSNVDYGAHLRTALPEESKMAVPKQCHSTQLGEIDIVNKNGNLDKAIVYDRNIFANQRSRLRGLGDAIRGDLPIPRDQSSCGWFSVSANPETDLRRGALDIIGGYNNETSHALHQLQGNADHSYDTSFKQSEIRIVNNGADIIIDSGTQLPTSSCA